MVTNPRDSAAGFDYRWSVSEKHIKDVTFPLVGELTFCQ